ncbi:hypothetical protein BLA29_012865, partial [Euroglyphus maynei]
MDEYTDRLEKYLDNLPPSSSNQNDEVTDVINRTANLSISNDNQSTLKPSQLPSFDGKFSSWKSYKMIIEDVLINKGTDNESLRKSTLLKTLKDDSYVYVNNLIAQGISLAEIWAKM